MLAAGLACAGAQPAQHSARPTQPRREPHVHAEPRRGVSEAPPRAQVRVRGLHGTLNESDVNLAMDGRQAEFGRCITNSRRSLRWVSGSIHFSFKVDAEGRIVDMRCVDSSIGHRVLEQCIGSVVAETQFRKPSGGETARFDWQMSVDPASGRAPSELDSARLKPLLQRRTHELVRACGVDRAHERFRITAYLDKRGRVLSAGAVASPSGAEDKLDCVLQEIRGWHLPKYARQGKLSFEIH